MLLPQVWKRLGEAEGVWSQLVVPLESRRCAPRDFKALALALTDEEEGPEGVFARLLEYDRENFLLACSIAGEEVRGARRRRRSLQVL